MQPPARHPQEVARLEALRESRLLDTASEALFDEIVHLAARVCSVPTALISLVDRDRQWFKAKTGLDGVSETARDISFCGHAILGENLFEVVDARQDERFADNPLVTGEPGVCFYAAHPVVDRQSGLPIGTLCVLDSRPRRLEVHQRAMLVHLATLTEGIIDARRQVISLTDRLAQQEARYRRLYTDTPAMLHSL